MTRSYQLELKRGVKKSQMCFVQGLFVCSIVMAHYNSPYNSYS